MNKNRNTDVKVYKNIKHSVLCTCGKCPECLKQYQNDWMTRIYSELKCQHVAVFFTLTYREDTVPSNVDPETGEVYLTVRRVQVASWLKQMREHRRKAGLSTDFKWFITSEYGPTTLRPHYHGIILGLSSSDVQPYLSKWAKQYGFTMAREFGLVDSKSALCTIRYTAKYCAKGPFENPLVASGKVEPTFHLISKGLGKSYMTNDKRSYFLALDFSGPRLSGRKYTDSYLQEVSKRLVFTIPPYSYHLSRYYRDMVFAQRKDLQVSYSDFVCRRLLECGSPELVRISTEKPFGGFTEADHEAIRKDYLQSVSDISQRKENARKGVVKHLIKSKI